jgi:hypothetical protein
MRHRLDYRRRHEMARRRSISIGRSGKDVRSFYRNVSVVFVRGEEAEDENFILSCIIGGEIEY